MNIITTLNELEFLHHKLETKLLRIEHAFRTNGPNPKLLKEFLKLEKLYIKLQSLIEYLQSHAQTPYHSHFIISKNSTNASNN